MREVNRYRMSFNDGSSAMVVLEDFFNRATYERDAALAREAALREELQTAQRGLANCKLALDAQTHNYGVTNLRLIGAEQRLTAADERADHWRSVASESTCRAAELNAQADETDRVLRSSVPGVFKNATSAVVAAQNYIASLEREIETFPSVLFQDCDFNGKNRDGSPPFEFTGGFPNRIKSIRMVGWVCEGPIKTVELQVSLPALKPVPEDRKLPAAQHQGEPVKPYAWFMFEEGKEFDGFMIYEKHERSKDLSGNYWDSFPLYRHPVEQPAPVAEAAHDPV